MKKINLQSLMLFIVFIGTIFTLLIIHIVTPDSDQSVLENRKLAKRPDFTFERYISGEYSQRFDTYYSDQFPMRDFFVENNAKINHTVFRQDVVDDVYIAEDGYLLSRINEATSEEAHVVANRINDFAKDMDEIGVSVYTAIMPNKSTMMEDKFPSYFQSYGQKNLDLLFENLYPITNPIDSRTILEEHMDEENMFYYTDHHWQAKAAFYAYQNVMNTIIKKENLDESVLKYSDYQWEIKGKPFYGSDARKTAASNLKKKDQIVVATLKGDYIPFKMKWGIKSREGLYDMSFLNTKNVYSNRYQAYMGGDYALLTVYNDNKKNGTNVLVIKDSYANAFIQFLAPHYKEIHVMDLRHYKGEPIKKYVQDHNINHIIILNNVNSIFVTPSLTDFENPGQGENQ